MTARAGNLLWNRVHQDLVGGENNIDTLLKTSIQAWGADQPSLGLHQAAPPALGAIPASRVMVIPLPPLAAWTGVEIGEPYFDTDTNTVHVTMSAPDDVTVNVLFWCPHTIDGPGQADPYNDAV